MIGGWSKISVTLLHHGPTIPNIFLDDVIKELPSPLFNTNIFQVLVRDRLRKILDEDAEFLELSTTAG